MKAEPSILKSVALTVAMRWTDRLIAFLSTIILARLLVPADFGIVAQGYMVIGLISTVIDLGVGLALIQNREATPDHYNTAWTMRIGEAICIAVVIFLAAPLAGNYFHEPRVVPVMRLLGAGTVLASFENMWVVSFQKEMRFGLDFQFAFLKRFSGFAVTVVLAAAFQSYWALVAGALSSTVIGVAISYRLHRGRPRLSISRLGELFAFSQWALVRSIGNYLLVELHRLLVGGRSSTATLGAYSLATDISTMPSTELLAPLYRALFPAFVQAKKNPEEVKRIYLLAQGLQTMLVIPASAGLALVASEGVAILLGQKWTMVVPFLQVLALVEMGNAVLTGSGYILITMGGICRSATIAWVQVLSFAVGAFVLFPNAGALQLAWLRFASVMCGVVAAIWAIRGVLPGLRTTHITNQIWRPVLATVVMAVVLVSLDRGMAVPVFLALLTKMFVGTVVYTLTLMGFWALSGRPIGAETYAMDKISTFWNRLRRARSDVTVTGATRSMKRRVS